ncbi:MAG: hypothetical protein PHQ52_07770 [Candidatus Omnitrophica bacterium]|jgi:hypothetical protein|nr:hypothetical protein [Candidatus Omnitrophota bacterium]
MDLANVLENAKLFLRILLVFISCMSVLLLIAPSVFVTAAHRLQERKGVKKEVFPWLEDDRMEIDLFLFKYRKIVGVLAIIISVVLFIIIP